MRRREFTRLLALLPAAVLAPPLLAQNAARPSAAQRSDAANLLEWLGVTAVIEQAPAALDYALAAERRARNATSAQESSWRRALAADFNARALREQVLTALLARAEAPLLRHTSALLQQPLARRMRYFEQAMTQRGAPTNLREFLDRLPATPQPAERRQAIEAIEATLRYAELVATLQTHAARAVQLRAGPAPVTPLGPLAEEIALRQRYLEPLLTDYLLYVWRYMTVAELVAYGELLAEPKLQQLLELMRAAVTATLTGILDKAAPAA